MDPEYFRKTVNRYAERLLRGAVRESTLEQVKPAIRILHLMEGKTCYSSVRKYVRNSGQVYLVVAYAELYTEMKPSGNVPMVWQHSPCA